MQESFQKVVLLYRLDAGSYSEVGADSCTDCDAGYYSVMLVLALVKSVLMAKFLKINQSDCNACGVGFKRW